MKIGQSTQVVPVHQKNGTRFIKKRNISKNPWVRNILFMKTISIFINYTFFRFNLKSTWSVMTHEKLIS